MSRSGTATRGLALLALALLFVAVVCFVLWEAAARFHAQRAVEAWEHHAVRCLREIRSAIECYREKEDGEPASIEVLYTNGCLIAGTSFRVSPSETLETLRNADTVWSQIDQVIVRRALADATLARDAIIAIALPTADAPRQAAILRRDGVIGSLSYSDFEKDRDLWLRAMAGFSPWPGE